MVGFEDKNNIKMAKKYFWENVYAINMDCLGKLVYVEPSVETVDCRFINTTVCRFYHLDLYTCTPEDAVFA